MTREDIIRMAKEANIGTYINLDSHLVGNHLERFAHLVAAAENKACAQIADASEPYKAMDLIMSRWKA